MFKYTILVVALTLCKGISSTASSGCRSAKADIVFLLDASGSVGDANFELQKEFVANFSKAFDIGPNSVQVSVVTFSTFPHEEFKLNSNKNLPQLIAAIHKIKYTQGATLTHAALFFARNSSFTAAAGDRHGVINILIIMTDGRSNIPRLTAKESYLIHQYDIKVITIGIGNATDLNELRTMATDQQDVFPVKSFDALYNALKLIRGATCNIEAKSASTPMSATKPNRRSTTTATNRTSTTTKTSTIPITTTRKPTPTTTSTTTTTTTTKTSTIPITTTRKPTPTTTSTTTTTTTTTTTKTSTIPITTTRKPTPTTTTTATTTTKALISQKITKHSTMNMPTSSTPITTALTITKSTNIPISPTITKTSTSKIPTSPTTTLSRRIKTTTPPTTPSPSTPFKTTISTSLTTLPPSTANATTTPTSSTTTTRVTSTKTPTTTKSKTTTISASKTTTITPSAATKTATSSTRTGNGQNAHLFNANINNAIPTRSAPNERVVEVADKTHIVVCIILGAILILLVLVSTIRQYCVLNGKNKKGQIAIDALNF